MGAETFEWAGVKYRVSCDMMARARVEGRILEDTGDHMTFQSVLNRAALGLPAFVAILMMFCTKKSGKDGVWDILEIGDVGVLSQNEAASELWGEALGASLVAEGNALGVKVVSDTPLPNGAALDTNQETSLTSPRGQSKPPLKARKKN